MAESHPSTAQFSSDVWVEEGPGQSVPATLRLLGQQLSLTLRSGRVVVDVPVEGAHARFRTLDFFVAFDLTVGSETHRLSLVTPLPDMAGLAVARRTGRRWRSLLAE